MRSAIVSIANSMSSPDSSDSAILKQPDSKSADIKVIMTVGNVALPMILPTAISVFLCAT